MHGFVPLSQSAREQDDLGFCRRRLADRAVPHRVVIVGSVSTPEAGAEKMGDLTGENS